MILLETMKFKPTIAKSIVSVLGGAGAYFVSAKLFGIFARPGECLPDPSNPGTQICADFAPSAGLWPYVIFVAAIVLIYVIWSMAAKE